MRVSLLQLALVALACAAMTHSAHAASGLTSVAAAGAGGLWRTTDGWQTSTLVLNATVNRVAFPSSNVGYAVGDAIWTTNDGGATWTEQFQVNGGVGGGIALAACSETHAVASFLVVGSKHLSGGVRVTTVDGGATWHATPPQVTGFVSLDVTTSGPQAVFGAKMYPRGGPTMISIEKSTDCGATWDIQYNFTDANLPSNFFLQNAFDLHAAFDTQTKGLLAGFFREVPIPDSSRAQGCSLGSALQRSAMHKPSSAAGTATCGSGGLMESIDGGKSYTDVWPPTQPITMNGTTCGTTLYDAAYVAKADGGQSTLFVVGGSFWPWDHAGFVLKSDDGGKTFSNVFNTNTSNMHRIAFGPSGEHGCIAGASRAIDHGSGARTASVACTVDGGTTWADGRNFPFPLVKDEFKGLWGDSDVAVLS